MTLTLPGVARRTRATPSPSGPLPWLSQGPDTYHLGAASPTREAAPLPVEGRQLLTSNTVPALHWRTMNDPADSDQSTGAFLAAFVHKLGSPIGTITNRLFLLQMEQDPAALKGGLEALGRSNDALKELLNAARRWLDAEAALTTPAELVDPSGALERARARLQTPIELTLVDPLPMIHAPSEAVVRVFVELLDNVARHGGAGTAALVLPVGERTPDTVRIAIEDEGPGWPREGPVTVFQPFGEGAGVGLAVVSHLVARIGGRVEAETAARGGARVVLELPAG